MKRLIYVEKEMQLKNMEESETIKFWVSTPISSHSGYIYDIQHFLLFCRHNFMKYKKHRGKVDKLTHKIKLLRMKM